MCIIILSERLRRLDAAISRALLAKSAVVAELLGVPAHNYAHVAELAVADVMGQVGELLFQYILSSF